MQPLLIAILLLLFAHDAIVIQLGITAPRTSASEFLLTSLSLKLAIAGGYYALIRMKYRQLRDHREARGKVWTQIARWVSLYQATVLALFAVDLVTGGLLVIREQVGNLVMIDELLLLLPTVAMLLWHWYVYYPVDRVLRQGMLIKRAAAGMPTRAVWSRREYVTTQTRHQLGMIMLPLLLILSWIEFSERLGPERWNVIGAAYIVPLTLGGAMLMFLMMPIFLRLLWDTEPLPGGEVRRFLLELCRRHGVKVRELLIWKTHGAVFNAAVMGLHARLRFILLTDGLLEQLDQKHIEAIMAHELAHVKHRHLIWLLVSALAVGSVFQAGLTFVFAALLSYVTAPTWFSGLWVEGFGPNEAAFSVIILLTCAGWLWGFGVVSRLTERQADTFAVEHMVMMREEPERDQAGRVVVDAASAYAMIGALDRVAELNHMSRTRHNWRHGSIAVRQDYLQTLVGQPVDKLKVNRHMRIVNIVSLLIMLSIIAFLAMQ